MIHDALTWPWLGPIAAAVALALCAAIVIRELRRPMDDTDRRCAAIDQELDEQEAARRRVDAMCAALSADLDALTFAWPDVPPWAPAGDPEFAPLGAMRRRDPRA